MLHSFFDERSFHSKNKASLEHRWNQSKLFFETRNKGFDPGTPHHGALDGCVLIGPDTCGKITLLFQLAYNLVKQNIEQDPFYNVVIICSRSIPAPSHLYQVNSENDDETNEELNRRILSAIHMKYVDNMFMLTQYLANLHLLPLEKLPRFLIVHNMSNLILSSTVDSSIDNYAPAVELEGSDVKMFDAGHMKLLALLQNVAQFLIDALSQNKANSTGEETIPSFVISDKIQSHLFYDRWCETMIQIQELDEPSHINNLVPRYRAVYTKFAGRRDHSQTKLVYELRSAGDIAISFIDYAQC